MRASRAIETSRWYQPRSSQREFVSVIRRIHVIGCDSETPFLPGKKSVISLMIVGIVNQDTENHAPEEFDTIGVGIRVLGLQQVTIGMTG